MIFVIIVLVGVFLWWSLVPSKNQRAGINSKSYKKTNSYISTEEALQLVEKGKEGRFREFVLMEMEKALKFALKDCPEEDRNVVIYFCLEKLKQRFVSNAEEFAAESQLSISQVHTIINSCFDKYLQ